MDYYQCRSAAAHNKETPELPTPPTSGWVACVVRPSSFATSGRRAGRRAGPSASGRAGRRAGPSSASLTSGRGAGGFVAAAPPPALRLLRAASNAATVDEAGAVRSADDTTASGGDGGGGGGGGDDEETCGARWPALPAGSPLWCCECTCNTTGRLSCCKCTRNMTPPPGGATQRTTTEHDLYLAEWVLRERVVEGVLRGDPSLGWEVMVPSRGLLAGSLVVVDYCCCRCRRRATPPRRVLMLMLLVVVESHVPSRDPFARRGLWYARFSRTARRFCVCRGPKKGRKEGREEGRKEGRKEGEKEDGRPKKEEGKRKREEGRRTITRRHIYIYIWGVSRVTPHGFVA